MSNEEKKETDLSKFQIAMVKLLSGEVIIAQASNRTVHESGRVTIDLSFAYQIVETYDPLSGEAELEYRQFMPYMPFIRLDLHMVVLSGLPSKEMLEDFFELVSEDISNLEASGEYADEDEINDDEPKQEEKDERVLH